VYELFNQHLFHKKSQDLYLHKKTHPLLVTASKTLAERLSWVLNKYENALILGPYNYILEDMLEEVCPFFLNKNTVIQFKNIKFDSEKFPFNQDSFDCIISFFDIQSINDVPGYLKQIDYCLKENGLFLGVFLGNESLLSLKKYIINKEFLFDEGASMRFHPTITPEVASQLLNRAGFDCPIADYNRYKLENTICEYIQNLRMLKATSLLKKYDLMPKKLGYMLLKDDTPIETCIDFVFMTGLGKRRKNQPELTSVKRNNLIKTS
jgi:SAM-dependent methyltransferase